MGRATGTVPTLFLLIFPGGGRGEAEVFIMKGLTVEQKRFLESQGLSEQDLFNAQGMTQSEYYPIMKQQNKLIAYNTPPCKNGHTLRTRSGHCPQCNTAYLRFSRRSSDAGFVYVAASLSGRISKVGFTSAIATRAESLNRTYYASLNDWKILFAIQSQNAGRIEDAVKSSLSQYSDTLEYDHDGKLQSASELLRCNYLKIREAIISVCKKYKYKYKTVLYLDEPDYQF